MLNSKEQDRKNRQLIESGRVKMIESIEAGNRQDNLKKIDSGFNHVLATLASKHKVAIAIDAGQLSSLSPIDKAKRLAKIRYNLAIGRKANTKFITLGTKEGQSLLLSLGASSQQAKKTEA